MTRTIITAVAALALAAPAFAQQSPAQAAAEQFNESLGGNELIILNPGTGMTPEAAEIFEEMAENSNSGNPANDPTAGELLDTNSVANAEAAAILKKLEEEEGSGAVN